MRLCIRTEEVLTNSVQRLIPVLEMSFSRIRSFRSHGAERKNANDRAIVEKHIRRFVRSRTCNTTALQSSRTPFSPTIERSRKTVIGHYQRTRTGFHSL